MGNHNFRVNFQKNLVNSFGRDCLVYPENPFSLDNPDALVRKGSTLYALFIPMYHERENFDHLLRRLFMSEFSYGSKLHTVLVLKEDDKLSEHGERLLSESFCHIARGGTDALTYISSPINTGRIWTQIGDCRQWLYRQYDANNKTVAFSLKEYGLPKIQEFQLLELERFSSPSWYSSNKRCFIKNVAKYRYVDMCLKKKGKGQSFREGFENIMTQALLKNFTIDGGYLVPNFHIVDNIFGVATDWNVMAEDGNLTNYGRTLSFSGVLPLNILDEERLERIHGFYINIQNKLYHGHR